MNFNKIRNGSKHLRRGSSSSEEAKEGAELAEKAEEYELAPVIKILLDKAVGELPLLEKLANRGSVGKGDLEIYKATTRSLCKRLKKQVTEVKFNDENFDEMMDRKLKELSELIDAVDAKTESIVATLKSSEVPFLQNHRTTITMRESLAVAARCLQSG
eukprot:TRINITY_DN9396_c0_g5_i2.p1 TRINITY_DN9396_c0_g5~~TRINITY_DN9396_c0_g5_i2.p1  ORF type:complete len:159 (-),score=29.31 TRINITY_DN9396_c0_g5_i2:501-977(-)